MSNLLLRMLGVVTLLGLCAVARADTWVVRSDAWCPYNCAPNDRNPGYLVEILQGAARANGHQVDYQLLPYSRALLQAQQGRITAVAGMVDFGRQGFIFSEPMGVDSNCLVVKHGSTLRYRSPQDLDRLAPIGVNEGYGYPQEFTQWRALNAHRVQELAGDGTLARHTQKLLLGRITSFLENENVVRYAATHVPDLRGVEVAGCMAGRDPIFIGYSRKHPKAAEIKAQVDRHVALMRQSGELQRLLDKYQVKPWWEAAQRP